MWGKYKENGFWLTPRSRFVFLLNKYRLYISFGRVKFRLLFSENVKWFHDMRET